jgi:acetylornithine/N-succinyldiaminopimelate aminotransferase
VEYCLRVVSGMLPRPLLLTMADSYCGAYGLAHGRDPGRWATFDWFPCAECADDRTCDARCPRFAAIPFATVGAFVFEPGSSSGFVRFAPDKLVAAIAARVQADGGFVVANEVTTGLGRTGAWFGFCHANLRPDFVALGKGLGGGYPVAMAAVGPRAAAQLAAPPAYAQSHQNDPLGAAVILAVLEVFRQDDLLARAAANAAQLVEGLRRLAAAGGALSQVRARGSMIALDVAEGKEAAVRVHRALLAAGYLVGLRPGTPTLRLDPPFCLEPAEIEGFLTALANSLDT